jgi:hypothetical protein
MSSIDPYRTKFLNKKFDFRKDGYSANELFKLARMSGDDMADETKRAKLASIDWYTDQFSQLTPKDAAAKAMLDYIQAGYASARADIVADLAKPPRPLECSPLTNRCE